MYKMLRVYLMITFNISSEKIITLNNKAPLVLIAGPCAIENREHALFMAQEIKKISEYVNIPFIYKSSYEKANRLSHTSYQGVGIKRGLSILEEVRSTIKVPILTDIHSEGQAISASKVVDILQISSMRCRDTKLVQAAAKTGKPLHIKKNEALAPNDMQYIMDKAYDAGNPNIALCERGTQFGYGHFVVDMRSLVIMGETKAPVTFDVSHSIQRPGGLGGKSGGDAKFIVPLARAAVAVGIAGIFIEVHDNPSKAPCDSASMLPLQELQDLLICLRKIDMIVKNYH